MADRPSIIAAARAEVEKQVANFQRKAEQRERLKRGQYHATAAVLELSRIDDEALIEPSFSLTKTTDKDGKGKRRTAKRERMNRKGRGSELA